MANALEVASLYGTLALVDNFTQPLGDALSQARGFGDRIGAVGDAVRNLGTNMTALTAPVMEFGKTGIEGVSSFQDVLAEIQVRAGLTADEMVRVRETAVAFGADPRLRATAQSSADAMLQLLTSGQNLEEALTTLPAVLTAASAANTELGYTADAVTDIMAAFQLPVEDASSVVDALARASGASSATMTDLIAGFQNVAGRAKAAGLSVEDTAAILAVFSENGIKGAEAGTQLKSMLNAMAGDTADVKELWAELGFSMYDAEGSARDLEDVMGDLRVALEGMSDEKRNKTIKALAGNYGQLGLMALTAGGSIEDMLALMDESASAEDIAAARMDTFSGATDRLGDAVETLQLVALEPFVENIAGPFIESISEVIGKVTDWMMANPELANTIVTIIAAVVAAGPVLIGLGTVMTSVGSIVGILGAGIGLLASPIGIIVAAVAGLAVAFATNFGGIRDAVMPILERVKTTIETMWGAVQPILENLRAWFVERVMPAIADVIQNHVLPVLGRFQQFLADLWGIVGPHLQNLYNWFVEDALPAIQNFIVDVVIPVVGRLTDIIGSIWDKVSPALLSIADWFLNSALPKVADFIETIVVPIVENLIEIIAAIWRIIGPPLESVAKWFLDDALPAIVNFIETVVVPIFEFFFGILEDVLSFIGDVLGAIGDVINGIGDFAGKVGGAIDDLNPFTGSGFLSGVFAEGGQASAGGRYLVGEEGPEIFVPKSSGYVVPNDALGRAGGGDVNITIQLTPDTIADDSDVQRRAQDLGEQIADRLRARGGGATVAA